MSVISSSTKLLFCEGKPDSLDYAILSRLIGNPNIIIPAGFPNKPVLFSHRACIENYLLDAVLIQAYWIEMSQGPKWKYGEPPSIDQIEAWIKKSAENINDYQTVRWTLAHLKPAKGWSQIETTWTKGSGHLPSSLKMSDCYKQANKLIKNFADSIKEVNQDKFEKHLNLYQAKLQETEFWTQKKYLVWFHGKDLKKAMQKEWPHSISLDKFCAWATAHLELTKHPDLLELKTRIQQQ